MTILILHGIGGHAGIHWQQWLHDELLKSGQTVLMPELPGANHPDRQTWLESVENTLKDYLPDKLIIVGHSLGVATSLDYIETLKSPVHGFIGVSGFAVDYGAELNGYFMHERSIDFVKVRKNIEKCVVFYGDNDPYVTQEALKDLAVDLQVEPIVISKGGHLNTEAGYTEFPLLLGEINAII